METSHNALHDNTIIIGQSLILVFLLYRNLKHGSLQSLGPLVTSPRRRYVPPRFLHDSCAQIDFAFAQTYPALFGLYRNGFLPKDVKIVGYARTKMDEAEYHKRITSYIKVPEGDKKFEQTLQEFKGFSSYISGGYDDSESFQNLNAALENIENGYPSNTQRNRLFYLALPPSVFIPVSKHLKEQCYVKGGQNRIIIEKPFGKDLASARELLSSVKQHWSEDETYRIDHYLGKEMVKNLLVLRFANVALGAAWDKNSISNVQITFKEPFGTEGRGGYFDEFGIIRDILQNRV